MKYTDEIMKEDDRQPNGTLKRAIIIDVDSKIAEINILRKRGFSWEKTSIGVLVGGYSFIVFDMTGNKFLEAQP